MSAGVGAGLSYAGWDLNPGTNHLRTNTVHPLTIPIIDSEDGDGRRWSTVGVSANIVDASFEALLDAINWKLIRDGVKTA